VIDRNDHELYRTLITDNFLHLDHHEDEQTNTPHKQSSNHDIRISNNNNNNYGNSNNGGDNDDDDNDGDEENEHHSSSSRLQLSSNSNFNFTIKKERKDIKKRGKEDEFPFTRAIPHLYIRIKRFLINIEIISSLCSKYDAVILDATSHVIHQLINCFLLNLEESFNHKNFLQLIQIYQNFRELVTSFGNVPFLLHCFDLSHFLIRNFKAKLVDSLRSSLRNIEEKLGELFTLKIREFFTSFLTVDVNWYVSNTTPFHHLISISP
jgi:hypothetical protein